MVFQMRTGFTEGIIWVNFHFEIRMPESHSYPAARADFSLTFFSDG